MNPLKPLTRAVFHGHKWRFNPSWPNDSEPRPAERGDPGASENGLRRRKVRLTLMREHPALHRPMTLKERKQCTVRKARKLDRKKVLELHNKGLSTQEIAQH